MEAQSDKIIHYRIDLAAEVLEDMQFPDLGSDVQMHALDGNILEPLDEFHLLLHFFVGDSEFGICLTGVNAGIGLWIYVRVDAKSHIHHLSGFPGKAVHKQKFLY